MKDDPNVKLVGQKYAKYEVRSIDIENLHLNKSQLLVPEFDQMLEAQIDAVWSILESEGYDITGKNIVLFRGKYVKEKPLTAADKRNKHLETMALLYPEAIIDSKAEDSRFPDDPKNNIKPFTFLDHCTKFILAANAALTSDIKIEHRLNFAYKAGESYKTLLVLAEYNGLQKKIASKVRKKALNDIFVNLKRLKAGGQTPKEIWPYFVNALRVDIENFDEITEVRPNMHNIKSFFVEFDVIKEGKRLQTSKMNYTAYYKKFSS
jgi:hypothetical protein